MTLVDTNVFIDILSNDPVWRSWSIAAMERMSRLGSLIITDLTYAELASRFESYQSVDRIIDGFGVTLERIPKQALFLAGRAFERYRRVGGSRLNVLADFFIGAHAEAAHVPIMTRDVRRYRKYFPDVSLIAPEQ